MRWGSLLPPAWPALALALASPGIAAAADFAVPFHWVDGMPCDEVYVMPDPLGLDAHRLAAVPLAPTTVERAIVPSGVDDGGAAPAKPRYAPDWPPAEIRTGPPVATTAAPGTAAVP